MKPKHKKNPRFRTEMGAFLNILANPTEVDTIWGNQLKAAGVNALSSMRIKRHVVVFIFL